jgi:hypothetical protein
MELFDEKTGGRKSRDRVPLNSIHNIALLFCSIRTKVCVLFYYRFFLNCFFTQEGTPHILRFFLLYTVIAPAAPQETVGEAGIEPGTAA